MKTKYVLKYVDEKLKLFTLHHIQIQNNRLTKFENFLHGKYKLDKHEEALASLYYAAGFNEGIKYTLRLVKK
jgi:hypothetical protein